MADRRPLVIVDGLTSELPIGDRLSGIPPAIANGQPATFEQLASGSTGLWEGGLEYAVRPSNGTAIFTQGNAPSTGGTISTPSLALTSYLTSVRRSIFTGAATAGTMIFMRSAALYVWGGNSVNRGGYRLVIRIGLETKVAGQRGFFGLAADASTTPTNIDPLTSSTAGKVGLAFNTNTGNWQLINNIAGTAPTILDLGVNFPLNTTDGIELVLTKLPNAATIPYTVTNLATRVSTSGTLSANIPANISFLSPTSWMTNNTTAAAFAFSNILTRLTSPN